MNVLMFGWQFPPCISGGLGTACHGLTRALAALDVRILFVLPRGPSERWPFPRLELRGADEVALLDPSHSRPAAAPPLRQLAVPSVLTPYLSAATYRERLAAARRPVRRPVAPDPPGTRRLAFTGQYGGDLFAEVSRYAEIGGRLGASERFDVIHAHDWMTYPAGVAAKRASGRPLICHCHATEFDRAGDRPNLDIAGLERFGLEQADRIFAVSQRTKDLLVRRYRLPAGKIAVVHNAVAKDPGRRPARRPRALDEKVVLFLGRVTQQKGPEYFVEAAAKGEELARKTLEEAGEYLGAKLAFLINLFNPEVVVVGRGIEQAGDIFFSAVRRSVKKWAYDESVKIVKIVPTSLGEDVVAVGAGALVIQDLFAKV
jgi:glycosyltransferase involved in cell wall biosynthesis